MLWGTYEFIFNDLRAFMRGFCCADDRKLERRKRGARNLRRREDQVDKFKKTAVEVVGGLIGCLILCGGPFLKFGWETAKHYV